MTLLSGEAGSGKSHLARTMAELARSHDYRVLSATSYPEAGGNLSPFPELLEEALSALSEADLQDCLSRCNPEIYRLLPGLSHRFQNRPVALADQNSTATFSTILQALNWLGRQQKLVLVLDDWQTLSGTALRLLHYLLTHPSLARLVVVGTLETTVAAAPLPELNALVNWASESGAIIHRLGRLPIQPLGRMLAASLNAPLDESTLAKIAEKCWGNPRIALELAHGWSESGAMRLIDGTWQLTGANDEPLPSRLTSYIKRLVANFSNEAQTLLNLAALAGPDFSFELLRKIVAERSDGAGWWIDLDKTRLGAVLLEVTRAGLIAETSRGYSLAFPMLAAGLVENMSHSQRSCWHEVIEWARRPQV